MSNEHVLVVGIHPVTELLKSDRKISKVMIDEGRDDPAIKEIERLAEERRCGVSWSSRKELDRVAKDMVHQGAIAFAGQLTVKSLQDIIALDGRRFVVVCDHITDPHNLGAIIRSANAFGATAVVVPDRRAASMTPVVEKASAGATSHTPLVTVPGLQAAVQTMKDAGLWVVALDGEGDTELEDVKVLDGDVVIIIGAEGDGVSRTLLSSADVVARLPLSGQVSSLNASVAAGIALYAARTPRS